MLVSFSNFHSWNFPMIFIRTTQEGGYSIAKLVVFCHQFTATAYSYVHRNLSGLIPSLKLCASRISIMCVRERVVWEKCLMFKH